MIYKETLMEYLERYYEQLEGELEAEQAGNQDPDVISQILGEMTAVELIQNELDNMLDIN